MASSISGSSRVKSIDILRGAVIVLMAIDHVRVYSGQPPGGPDAGIFFTRWITHFCAPGFAFFAGTSAFFYGQKLNNVKALAQYLVTRGLLLVILEMTLIRFCWTFNFNYLEFTLAGVIWMLGWCMMLMALLVKLRPAVVAIAGLAIIFLQQLFSLIPRILPTSLVPTIGGLWEFIYSSGTPPLPGIAILYVIVPWIGVMAAGYGFGMIMNLEPAKRNVRCLQIGLGGTALFLLAGTAIILRSPNSDGPAFIFRLLNQQKYPASQLYLMMTLGPIIALIPLAEKMRGLGADVLTIFGRAPFFYYLIHIPIIHLSALLVNVVRVGDFHQDWYGSAPFVHIGIESRWSLSLLYLIFVIDVLMLYFACRWYLKYKSENPANKLLRYL